MRVHIGSDLNQVILAHPVVRQVALDRLRLDLYDAAIAEARAKRDLPEPED